MAGNKPGTHLLCNMGSPTMRKRRRAARFVNQCDAERRNASSYVLPGEAVASGPLSPGERGM
jgi:hypothetical protein